MYPVVNINLNKIRHNTECLVNQCKEAGVNYIFGVTKVIAGHSEVVEALIDGGITHIADSRIDNLIKFNKYPLQKVYLRLPMLSEVENVVKYTDISLNSEIDVIKRLDKESKKQNKKHQIILMIDLGDLREGIWFEDDYLSIVSNVLKLKNIYLVGIGTNLTCYGGVIPTIDNLTKLLEIKEKIENKFSIKIQYVSGGNSSSLHLIQKNSLPKGVNNLRIGEGIFLGRETAYEQTIENTYQDAFILEAEIIELKEKPSIPIGEIGVDAFGKKPEFIDKGKIKRAIIGVGKQDVYLNNLIPIDKNIEIIGSSSDHLIADVSKCNYKIGNKINFRVNYGGLLQIMTSKYVTKKFY